MITPIIPEEITVHLGTPSSNAPNVRVSFKNYIKNVASSEIYPTWPDAALRANIYAQISFALNRIFTEYYRSRGYNFDITNSTAYDQSFIFGRDIFENISAIVDEIFNSYIRRKGNIEPLFAAYCDGIRVSCNGLSQWGSVDLAKRGYTPFAILQYYYGNNIEIVENVPVAGITESIPAVPLRTGLSGNEVQLLQIRLNRISKNFPAIPKIQPTDGIFGKETEDAVRAFQKIFNLKADGIVGKATWYEIIAIYNGVKKLNEVASEGLNLSEVSTQFPRELSRGMSGIPVRVLQYYLAYVAEYLESIPTIAVDGVFGEETENAVRAFQLTYGLPVTGVVDLPTWDKLYNVYLGFIESLSFYYRDGVVLPFPGNILRVGSRGDDVRVLQSYLNEIGTVYKRIPRLNVDGVFGSATADAVTQFMDLFDLAGRRGIVTSVTWDAIASVYSDIYNGNQAAAGQYPGYALGE